MHHKEGVLHAKPHKKRHFEPSFSKLLMRGGGLSLSNAQEIKPNLKEILPPSDLALLPKSKAEKQNAPVAYLDNSVVKLMAKMKTTDTLNVVINIRNPIVHDLPNGINSGEIIFNAPGNIEYKLNGVSVTEKEIRQFNKVKKERNLLIDKKKLINRKRIGQEMAKLLHFLPKSALEMIQAGKSHISTEITKKDLEKISRVKNIDSKALNIHLPYKKILHSTLNDIEDIDTVLSGIGVEAYGHNYGKTGEGVKVLLTEFECFPHNNVLNTPGYDISLDANPAAGTCLDKDKWHSSKITDTFFAVAPDAEVVWVTSKQEIDDPYRYDNGGLPLPLSYWNPDIVSLSGGFGSLIYNDDDEEWDRQAYEHNIILFNSMSNSPNNNFNANATTTSPGMGYNVITVGAYDQYEDDLICEFLHPNPISLGRSSTLAIKPDIVAPGCDFNGVYGSQSNRWGGKFGRTSGATPIAAGIMANRLDEVPGMKGHPAVAKAFMMATTKNIDGASIPVGITTSFDGVGATQMTPNYWNLRWWEGSHTSFFNYGPHSYGIKSIRFNEYFQGGVTYRIVISWLAEPWYARYMKKPHINLSLVVKQGNQVKASSMSAFNSFEIVEITKPTSGYYTVHIQKPWSAGYGNLKLGYV